MEETMLKSLHSERDSTAEKAQLTNCDDHVYHAMSGPFSFLRLPYQDEPGEPYGLFRPSLVNLLCTQGSVGLRLFSAEPGEPFKRQRRSQGI